MRFSDSHHLRLCAALSPSPPTPRPRIAVTNRGFSNARGPIDVEQVGMMSAPWRHRDRRFLPPAEEAIETKMPGRGVLGPRWLLFPTGGRLRFAVF